MALIANDGFHLEANTFVPVEAAHGDVVVPDGWQALTRGAGVLDTFTGRKVEDPAEPPNKALRIGVRLILPGLPPTG